MEYIIMEKVYGVYDGDAKCSVCKSDKIIIYKCKTCKEFYCLSCGNDRIVFHHFRHDKGYYISYNCCDQCCDKHYSCICHICSFKNSNLYMKLKNNNYMCKSCFE